jgi:hypothetical protein
MYLTKAVLSKEMVEMARYPVASGPVRDTSLDETTLLIWAAYT